MSTKMRNSLWVVELLDHKRWLPTVGVGLTKVDGDQELVRWRRELPDDRLRLRRYTSHSSNQQSARKGTSK